MDIVTLGAVLATLLVIVCVFATAVSVGRKIDQERHIGVK